MIQTYITKPTIRRAVQWTGANFEEIDEFSGNHFGLDDEGNAQIFNTHHNCWVSVFLGQWVVKGDDGECWPVDRKTFEKTYTLYEVDYVPDDFFRELFAEMSKSETPT